LMFYLCIYVICIISPSIAFVYLFTQSSAVSGLLMAFFSKYNQMNSFVYAHG
jgi:hypothetical protein